MHAPVTVMGLTPDMPWYEYTEVEHTAYALGWGVQSYRGPTMIRHTGGIDGFISSITFLPNDDFGIIVLTNLGENGWASIVMMNIADPEHSGQVSIGAGVIAIPEQSRPA